MKRGEEGRREWGARIYLMRTPTSQDESWRWRGGEERESPLEGVHHTRDPPVLRRAQHTQARNDLQQPTHTYTHRQEWGGDEGGDDDLSLWGGGVGVGWKKGDLRAS